MTRMDDGFETLPDDDSHIISWRDIAALTDTVEETVTRVRHAHGRLNDAERAGANHVLRNLGIRLSDIDTMSITQDNVIFHENIHAILDHLTEPPLHYEIGLSLRGLRQYSDIMPFVAAHEIGHGVLAHDQLTHLSAHDFAQYAATKLERSFYDATPCTRDDGIIGLFTKTMQNITSVALLPGRALSRYRENLCDDFALRVYPKVDLGQFADYLYTYPNRTAAPHLFSTHPPIDVRIARLRRKQDRLLASL